MTYEEILVDIKKQVGEADPAKIKGVDAVFQFELTGDNGGTFHAVVAEGKADIVDAVHDSPNVTIILSTDVLADLMDGKLNPTSAFMAGKLKVKGDMALAMKLQALIGSAR
ncbi:MAG: SCP2 sterol-binding domain-containing protein [Firmicutes bacterium]|jgi:putative sterol carrier protein|nr:SCP2 sterol-binding domain-containing protein [Bacillota bacterium]